MSGSVWQFVRLAALWLAVLFFTLPGPAAAGQEEEKKEIPEGWKLVPRIGLTIEYGGFIVNQDNYASRLRRRVDIDVLQYRRHIFYLNFDEKTSFGTPKDKWDFNFLKYDVVLGGYRYDLGDSYLGVFIHHQCNNPFRSEKYRVLIDRERANVYDIGLELLTKNMRPGWKDRGINFDSPQAFEFLGRFAWSATVSKTFVKQNTQLKWLATGRLRFDLLRYYRLIPYLEVAGELYVGPMVRAIPEVEVGTRYHLSKVDITPFFQWKRDQESLTVVPPDITRFISKNTLFGGARLEVMLDSEDVLLSPAGEKLQWFPEIHGNLGYALHLNKTNFNAYGNVELDLEVLRWQPWTLFFYTDMNFDSRKEDFKPDKVNYWMQYGLTYAGERYFIEGFVKNSQRLDANKFRGTQERANLAGLRVGTKGMKPGHFNDGISFAGPTFQWLNLWNAQAGAGHFFQNRDWQYLWNVDGKVRWDLLRWYIVVPYVQGELNWQAGGGRTRDTFEYAAEPGLRFHGVLDLALYYRYQHRDNVLYFRAPSANEHLFGIRAMF